MRRHRSLLVAALAPCALVTACGGSDLPLSHGVGYTPAQAQSGYTPAAGPGHRGRHSAAAPSSTAPTTAADEGVRDCQVTTQVSGAVTADWTGDGTDTIPTTGSKAQAVYAATTSGGLTITLAMPATGHSATAVLRSSDATFRIAKGSTKGLTFGDLKRGAIADADLVSAAHGTVRVIARFICDADFS